MGNRTLMLGVLVMAVAVLTVACAPRDVGPEPGFDGWANEVGQACYPNSIGSVQIKQLFYQSAFIDLASRLYYGNITPAAYRDGITGFLGPSTRNDASFACIFRNLPPRSMPNAPPGM